MPSRMDKHLLAKLGGLDALEKLDRGLRGVRVSLQSQGALPAGSRAERRACLEEHFAKIAETLAGAGARVDLGTISVSGQTVEAVLPVDDYDDMKRRLEDEGIRVDPVIDRQIV